MGTEASAEYQPSLTEWFLAVDDPEKSLAFMAEDRLKLDRLEAFSAITGLPCIRPTRFTGKDLAEPSPRFTAFLKENGEKKCGMRLVPTKDGLPKLRRRGFTLKEAYTEWFLTLNLNPDDYLAYIYDQPEQVSWSASIVVNEDLIFGELIPDMHPALRMGEAGPELVAFQYDLNDNKWRFSRHEPEAEEGAQRLVAALLIADPTVQQTLGRELGSLFAHGYLQGYFEMTIQNNTVYFLDYNRVVNGFVPNSGIKLAEVPAGSGLSGIPVYPGEVSGTVRIVQPEDCGSADFPAGSVLICLNTDMRYLPLMQKAAAIITEKGGVLSHAAVIARELKRPCIVQVKGATTELRNGELIKVDAHTGILHRLEQANKRTSSKDE